MEGSRDAIHAEQGDASAPASSAGGSASATPQDASDAVASQSAKVETEAMAKVNAALEAELEGVVRTDEAGAAASSTHGSHGAELEALRTQLRAALGRAAASSTAARKASSAQTSGGGAPIPGSGSFEAVDSHLGATVDASSEAFELQRKL